MTVPLIQYFILVNKVELHGNTSHSYLRASSDRKKIYNHYIITNFHYFRIQHDNTGIGAGWFLERVSTSIKKPF